MSDAGGAGRRDIELRIRAVDSTQADLRRLVQTIGDVTNALGKELEAAAAGKRSNDELRQSITLLEQAHKGLTGIGALVDQYRNLTTQIEASQAAVAKAAVAQNTYQAELAQTEAVTRAQEQSLRRLNTERERAERTLRQQVGMLETVGNDLRRAGVDTANLAGAERELVAAAEQLRTALGPLREAHASNTRVIREQREETARLREEEAQRVNDARRIAQAAQQANTSIVAAQKRIADEAKKRDDEGLQTQARLEGLRRKQAQDAQAEAERQTRLAAAETEKRALAEAAAVQNRAQLVQRAEASIQAAKKRGADEEQRRELEIQQTQLRLETFRRRQIADRQAQEERNQRLLQQNRERVQREQEAAARRIPGIPGLPAGAAGDAAQRLFGLRPYELQNLSFQINDVFTQLASGAHVTQVFAQQGGQIFQLFGKNLFDLLPALVRLTPLLAAAGIAAAALGRSFQTVTATREFSALLKSMGDVAGATGEDLTNLARSIERLGVSWDDARQMIRSGLSGGLDQGGILQLADISRNLGARQGEEPAKLFKELVTALRDGAEGIENFDRQYRVLDASQLRRMAQLQREQGLQAAQNFALDALSGKLRDAARDMSPFGDSMLKLTNAWKAFLDTFESTGAIRRGIAGITGLIEALTEALRLLEQLTNLVQNSPGLKTMADLAERASRWGLGPFGILRAPGQMMDWFRGGTGPDPNNTGWQAAAAAQRAAGVGQAAFVNPRGAQVDTEELKKAFEALAEAARTAGLPPGSRVEVLNTERPGATVAGTGEPSQHGMGRAVDVRIVDATGRPIPGSMGLTPRGTDVTGQYALLDAAFEAYIKARYPGLPYAIGTRFQSATDPGHYSVGMGREQLAQGAREGRLRPTPTDEARSERLLVIDNQRFDKQHDYNAQKALEAVYEEAVRDAKEKGLVGDQQRDFVNRKVFEAEQDRAEKTRKFEQDKTNQRLVDGKNAAAIDAAGKAALAAEIALHGNVLSLEKAQTIEMQGREEARKKFTNEESARTAQRKIDQDLNNAAIQVGLKGYTDVNKQLDLIRDKQRIERERVAKDIEDARGKGQTITDRPDLRAQVERRQLAQAEADIRLKEIETLAQTRQQTIAAVNAAVEAGGMTITEAQAATKRAFEATTPEIEKQTKAFQEFLQTNKDIDPTKLDQLTAKVKELRAQSQYISPLWKTIKETFETSFASNAVKAFDTIGEALGGLIAKTKSWADVWRSLRTAATSFFAGLLKDLASAILQAELKKLASSITGGVGGGGGFLSFLFGGAKAAGTIGTTATGAATELGGWSTASGLVLFKQGGVVGRTPAPTRQVWSADWNRVSLPRYQHGAIIGLAPDEQAAILHRGEEVLRADSPRNIMNGGGGGRPGEIAIRNVLIDDPRRIPEAMSGAHGERVIVQTIVKNAATVREVVKG